MARKPLPKKWHDHHGILHHTIETLEHGKMSLVVSKTWTGVNWEFHTDTRALVDYQRQLYADNIKGSRGQLP